MSWFSRTGVLSGLYWASVLPLFRAHVYEGSWSHTTYQLCMGLFHIGHCWQVVIVSKLSADTSLRLTVPTAATAMAVSGRGGRRLYHHLCLSVACRGSSVCVRYCLAMCRDYNRFSFCARTSYTSDYLESNTDLLQTSRIKVHTASAHK